MFKRYSIYIILICLFAWQYTNAQYWPSSTESATKPATIPRDVLYDPVVPSSLDSNMFSNPRLKEKKKTTNSGSDPVVNDDPGGPGGGGGGGGNPPEDGGVPLDGGVTVLLALGAGMRMRKKRMQKKDPTI